MRIIAKRRDYYDCIQRMGQDLSVRPYVREPEEVTYDLRGQSRSKWPFPLGPASYSRYRNGDDRPFDVDTYIVGFCGEIYGGLKLTYSVCKKYPPYTRQEFYSFCYSIEDVDAFVEAHLPSKMVEAYRQKLTNKWRNDRHVLQELRQAKFPCHHVRGNFIAFFESIKKQRHDFSHWFEEKKSPVFVATVDDWRQYGEVVYNAILDDVHFYQVFDPQQAYQQISMFMSNLAYPDVQEPEISDEMRAQKRGFDKWSFRKTPSKEG